MPRWNQIVERYLPWILRHRREERELDEEIRFHLQQEQNLLVERGQGPVDARQAAHRYFGNVRRVKEVTREMWSWTTGWREADDSNFRLLEFACDVGCPACTGVDVGAGKPGLDCVDHEGQVVVECFRDLLVALGTGPADEDVHSAMVARLLHCMQFLGRLALFGHVIEHNRNYR